MTKDDARHVSREKLYELVWAEPMTKVAERFNVSGSYLARICTLLNVPRPERGYWAKLAVGKAPARKPLTKARPGDADRWTKGTEPDTRIRPEAPAPRDAQGPSVRIPRNQVHGLLRDARAHFENGRSVEDGAYLKPYKRLLVDVTASAAGLDKAFELANDLFNGLQSIGHRVLLAPSAQGLRRGQLEEREAPDQPRNYMPYGLWSPAQPTVVYVGTVAIGLAVVEMTETVTMRYLNGKYLRESEYTPPNARRFDDYSWTIERTIPSGRMRIVAYSPYPQLIWAKQWQETKSAGLRGQVRAIVAEIEAQAPMLVTQLEEAERQAEVHRQERAVEWERYMRAEDRRHIDKSVADSKTELAGIIERWSRTMDIERFLAEVEHRCEKLSGDQRQAISERLALARSFIGTQDPLDFFRGWRTPEERYAPKYPDEDGD